MNTSIPYMLLLITIVTCIALFFSYRSNKARLLNGMILSFLLGELGLLTIVILSSLEISALTWFFVAIFLLIIIPAIILTSWAGVLLLINAVIVLRRENRSLGNLLTLFLGLGIILLPSILQLVDYLFPVWIAQGIRSLVGAIIGYFIFWLVSFVMSFLLYVLFKPRYNQEYIIVLGAGLINGREISGLLASRINRAITFAEKQFSKTNTRPLIIMSGGQGSDELLPEGEAMRQFAIEQGYPETLVMAEKESKTTYENMLFSKAIIEEKGLTLSKGIFCTSDYHVFRAAGYALNVGLKIDGIGANTKKYFVFNAFIREYIALLANHKKFHAICLGIITIAIIAMSIILGYTGNWQ